MYRPVLYTILELEVKPSRSSKRNKRRQRCKAAHIAAEAIRAAASRKAAEAARIHAAIDKEMEDEVLCILMTQYYLLCHKLSMRTSLLKICLLREFSKDENSSF